MEGRESAVLRCTSCGLETEHTLRYAGRLLVSTICGNCEFTWHHSDSDLRNAYVHDLESRVLSKPGRLIRRFRRRPLETALDLPRAALSQPVKLAREIVTILRG
ncbi:hypothetical protein ACNHUS_06375 [Actinomycetes bacterium M1A6_2h]